MPKRKVQLGCTCVVSDPSTSTPEIRDSIGNIISAGTVGTRSIPPGEWVELDEDEADRLERRFPYQTFEVQREANAAVQKAETLLGRRVATTSMRG